MNPILYVLMGIAGTGLVLSVIVHATSLTDIPPLLGESSWILGAGIFVVWIPAILVLHPTTREFKQKDLWRAALRGCPVWMRKAVVGFGVYAMINIAYFAYLTVGEPPGQDPTPAMMWRLLSGHGMVFYAVAFAVFYSALRTREHDPQRRCLAGHPVSPSARFCEECGQPVREGPLSETRH